jgi:hypothetical protein
MAVSGFALGGIDVSVIQILQTMLIRLYQQAEDTACVLRDLLLGPYVTADMNAFVKSTHKHVCSC